MRLFALLLLLAAFMPNAALYLAAAGVRRRYPLCDDEEEALPYGQRLSAFLLECAATNVAVVLSLLGSAVPERLGDPDAAVRVILLHGYAQTRGCAAMLARRLTDLGLGVVCFSYSSLRADVPAAAEELRRLVVELQKERRGPVHLVGFGLGGLVARYCVRRHRTPGVRRILTLGTAHLGTLLAPKFPRWLAQLRPESHFLAQLGAADRAPEQFEATAIQSTFDATILPPENAYYPAAFNVTVRDTGHFSLLFSARIFELIEENLELGDVSLDLVVPPECPPMRLDQFVVSRVEGVSRRRLRDVELCLNGSRAKHGARVQPGDVVSVPETLLDPGELAINRERTLPILHEDEALVAVDKPAGMASVALGSADVDCVANCLVALYPEVRHVGGRFEAGLVHRLDHDTSGVLVAARTAEAYDELRRQFSAHETEKQYLALVHGEILEGGEVDIPIAHDPKRSDRMLACVEEEKRERLGARPASTQYQPVLRFGRATLVRVTMRTGVRHQVRVHLAAIGHPIAGDRLYGSGPALAGLRRQALHASRVRLRHPLSGASLTIESRLPRDFEDALHRLERR